MLEVVAMASGKVSNDGSFFCHACLEDKSAAEQSPDLRYCQGCYELLLKEAELDTFRRGGDWRPVKPALSPDVEVQQGGEGVAQVNEYVRSILSTVEGKISKVDNNKVWATQVTKAETRGRKQVELPLGYIAWLAEGGMGYKKIAANVNVECGLNCSYRTIARVIRGERKQLALPISDIIGKKVELQGRW